MNKATLLQQANGRSAESFFEDTMHINKCLWPKWLLGFRKADKREDRCGIDFIAVTDVGDIFIQTKTSRDDAFEYIRLHRYVSYKVSVLVIKSNEIRGSLYGGLYQRTIYLLDQHRTKLLTKAAGWKFLLSLPFSSKIICHS